MVKFWSHALKFDNSNTWNLVVSDIMYFFCCLSLYCDSIQEASTYFKREIRRSIDKKIFLFQWFWKPAACHPHKCFQTRSTVNGSTAGYAQWHHEAPTSRSHELFMAYSNNLFLQKQIQSMWKSSSFWWSSNFLPVLYKTSPPGPALPLWSELWNGPGC